LRGGPTHPEIPLGVQRGSGHILDSSQDRVVYVGNRPSVTTNSSQSN
jgi:hypothetical protein